MSTDDNSDNNGIPEELTDKYISSSINITANDESFYITPKKLKNIPKISDLSEDERKTIKHSIVNVSKNCNVSYLNFFY